MPTAIARLTASNQSRLRIRSLAEAWSDAVDVVAAARDLGLELLDPARARGYALTRLGRVVGLAREPGEDDARYRARLRRRRILERTLATTDDLVELVRITLDLPASATVRPLSYPTEVRWEVGVPDGATLDPGLEAELGHVLDDAVAAGVGRGAVVETTSASFRFDLGPGFDEGELARVIAP